MGSNQPNSGLPTNGPTLPNTVVTQPTSRIYSANMGLSSSTLFSTNSARTSPIISNLQTFDCGLLYGCFLYPSGCSGNSCTFIYKWKSNGNNLTDFEINAQIETITNNWVGIAFSNDRIMVN